MSNFFEDVKNDVKGIWDGFKGDLESLGKDAKEHDEAENALYSWADGDVLTFPYWSENASEKDQIMRSLAVMMMKDNELVAPCNGIIAGISEADNTIAIALNKELTVAVKVCTSCTDFSKEATILVKKGEYVKAGQPLVSFASQIASKTKLLLITPEDDNEFKEYGLNPAVNPMNVKKGTKIIG